MGLIETALTTPKLGTFCSDMHLCLQFMLSLEFAVKVDIVWQLQECHFCRTGMIFYTTKIEVSKSSILSLQTTVCRERRELS